MANTSPTRQGTLADGGGNLGTKSTKKRVRVLLADDHAMVRDGLASYLDHLPEIEVVATASDGWEAVEQVRRTKPDVALVDIVMPGLNGIDAAAVIHEECPGVRIVIISVHADVAYVYRALRAGAQGYLAKTSAAPDVVEAIKTVMAGRRFLSKGITESLVDDYIQARGAEDPLDQLSVRERQILQQIAEGHSTADIARTLSLSPKTVDTYRSRMMEKLGITELPALIKFAIRHGLTPPE
jgi:DNA-binding NarL/FixJ family response regulator